MRRQTDKHDCFSTIRMFASAVTDNIEERFPDLLVWSSLRIFDPHAYSSKVTQLRGFGEENVKILLDHFSQPKGIDGVDFKELINQSAFQREWPIFK